MPGKRFLLLALTAALMLSGISGYAQTVTIVSGNGQLVCPACGQVTSNFSFTPLTVLVKDASGNPVPNTTVTWSAVASSTFGTAQVAVSQFTTTDATGQTSNTFSLAPLMIGAGAPPFVQANITASALGATATFTETSAQTTLAISVPPVGVLTGQAGQPASTPISITVTGATNFGAVGIQGVAIQLVSTSTTGPTISCASVSGPNTVLTDTTGTASCTPVFGSMTGTGQYNVSVGGNLFGPFDFSVSVGPPAAIVLTSGNNQSGNPGDLLFSPLIATVTDVSGNPVPGANVTWNISQGVATLVATNTTSGSDGRVSTSVRLGNSTVPVKITVSVANTPTITATFTANVSIVLTGLQKLSGDNQDAAINTQFGAPLVVQANVPAGQSASGIPVTFSVVSGGATVATPNAVTDSNGRASTTVQAASATGSVSITATSGSYSQTFSLTVRPAGPSNLSFLNGAGYQANFISPCSVAVLTGTGLATGLQGSVIPTNLVGALPLRIANVTVQFNGVFAPLFNVSNINGQESVTLQVPCETNPGTVPVTVSVSGSSATVNTQVSAVSPGIFQTPMSDNVSRAVLVRPDGSYVSLENPARRGETIYMYVTGIGPVTPAVGTNQAGFPGIDMKAVNPIVVGVNNAGVPVVSTMYAENLIGVYQIAFQLPVDAPAGNNVPLAIAVVQGGNTSFGNASSIPIQ